MKKYKILVLFLLSKILALYIEYCVHMTKILLMHLLQIIFFIIIIHRWYYGDIDFCIYLFKMFHNKISTININYEAII